MQKHHGKEGKQIGDVDLAIYEAGGVARGTEGVPTMSAQL